MAFFLGSLDIGARRSRHGTVVVFCFVLMAASLVGVQTAHAATTGTTSVTFVSEPGDFIGQGQQLLFTPSASTVITPSGDASYLTINVTQGTIGTPGSHWLTFNFAAAPGAPLTTGTYTGAGRAPFRGPGQPGIDINGDGRGCNTITGQFTVTEIGFTATGSLADLALTYEQHCEGAVPALFGEIRYQAAGGDPALLVAPARIDFPAKYVGVPSIDVPVTIINTGTAPVSVSSVTINGTNPSDFAVGSDSCTGVSLALGAQCALSVHFSPTAAGSRTATVSIADSTAAGGHTVTVSGTGTPGFAAMVLDSEPGDWVGAGQQLLFTPANATVSGGGSPGYVTISAITPGYGHWFYADLAAPPGQNLQPGTYLNATRAAFRAAGSPGIDVSGDGRGCNNDTGQFTIHEISFTPAGQLDTFSATFEQHCEGGVPALFGELRLKSTLPYRALDIAPQSVAFADQVIGQAGPTQSVVITSRGVEGLTMGGVSLTGPAASDFSVASDTCSGAVIPPGSSCAVGIRFAPGATGIRAATLAIADNTARGTHTVPLTGFGQPIPTTTVVSSDHNPSVFGQSITLRAQVSSASSAAPSQGTVTFADGGVSLASVPLVSGVATFSTSSLRVGTHNLTASYLGGPTFAPSTSTTVAQVVQPATTSTTVASSANPATPHQLIVFSATVRVQAPGSCVLSGWVSFFDGATLLGQVPLGPGGAVTMLSPGLAGGTHDVTAVYGGDSDCRSSTSTVLLQKVRGPAPH